MNYFVIYPDDNIKNKIEIKLSKDDIEKKEPFVHFTKIDGNTFKNSLIFVRSLFRTTILVADDLKELLELYIDVSDAVAVFAIDQDNYNNKLYWKINIPCINCIKEPFEPNKNIYNLDDEKINTQHIFTVTKSKSTYLIVDLILMEHLIKRGFLEIKFIKTLNSNI